ncbi:ABC transporter ATP-binding protein [Antarcticirhabdus aurantiaca]|uniref:ABC transporter ATP-binding protein n=1 Tax=Antarcticirhabdus aurantiaca TaxID=2606717 RepID=A0ACD4NMN0_9HYPH|nr:ABC transporter ATP-binding protein [Antarcticirhabdus aurantiaca]WAJ28180.1 ABC transporter ATP-binding protein [Jeongeuplla avenae]
MLWVENLDVRRGGTHALRGASLEVRRGEIVALIGANGAGKTTTLATISGLLRPRSGTVRFAAEPGATPIEITSLKAEAVVAAGLSHCPEGRQIFANLSVAENLAIGAFLRRDRDGIAKDIADVHRLFPILKERASVPGDRLSGGEQMMLAIGRALMSRPKLLLLDEPSLGLAPRLVEQIFDILERIRDEGMTVLLVEQNAAMALDIADRAYVLEAGSIVLEGTGRALAEDPNVQRAYLGAA